MKCLYCGEELFFARGRGCAHRWHHWEGGIYMMKCPNCAWMGAPYPSPIACPNCGSTAVRVDHCATPRMS